MTSISNPTTSTPGTNRNMTNPAPTAAPPRSYPPGPYWSAVVSGSALAPAPPPAPPTNRTSPVTNISTSQPAATITTSTKKNPDTTKQTQTPITSSATPSSSGEVTPASPYYSNASYAWTPHPYSTIPVNGAAAGGRVLGAPYLPYLYHQPQYTPYTPHYTGTTTTHYVPAMGEGGSPGSVPMVMYYPPAAPSSYGPPSPEMMSPGGGLSVQRTTHDDASASYHHPHQQHGYPPLYPYFTTAAPPYYQLQPLPPSHPAAAAAAATGYYTPYEEGYYHHEAQAPPTWSGSPSVGSSAANYPSPSTRTARGKGSYGSQRGGRVYRVRGPRSSSASQKPEAKGVGTSNEDEQKISRSSSSTSSSSSSSSASHVTDSNAAAASAEKQSHYYPQERQDLEEEEEEEEEDDDNQEYQGTSTIADSTSYYPSPDDSGFGNEYMYYHQEAYLPAPTLAYSSPSSTALEWTDYPPPPPPPAVQARFFIIKSFSPQDILQSVEHSLWSSTDPGNARLDKAYREATAVGIPIYLFFSVNGSRKFCGLALMTSPVDYQHSFAAWDQDNKYKGCFAVKWLMVKDVPNQALRHLRLYNNNNKPFTHARDTQEVPFEQGLEALQIMATYLQESSLVEKGGGSSLDDGNGMASQQYYPLSPRKKEEAAEWSKGTPTGQSNKEISPQEKLEEKETAVEAEKVDEKSVSSHILHEKASSNMRSPILIPTPAPLPTPSAYISPNPPPAPSSLLRGKGGGREIIQTTTAATASPTTPTTSNHACTNNPYHRGTTVGGTRFAAPSIRKRGEDNIDFVPSWPLHQRAPRAMSGPYGRFGGGRRDYAGMTTSNAASQPYQQQPRMAFVVKGAPQQTKSHHSDQETEEISAPELLRDMEKKASSLSISDESEGNKQQHSQVFVLVEGEVMVPASNELMAKSVQESHRIMNENRKEIEHKKVETGE